VKRAVEADLARFKAYVELGEADDLEYTVSPEEREGDDKNEDQDENKNENDNQDDGDEESAEDREKEPAGASST
jgi:hypothetical protein